MQTSIQAQPKGTFESGRTNTLCMCVARHVRRIWRCKNQVTRSSWSGIPKCLRLARDTTWARWSWRSAAAQTAEWTWGSLGIMTSTYLHMGRWLGVQEIRTCPEAWGVAHWQAARSRVLGDYLTYNSTWESGVFLRVVVRYKYPSKHIMYTNNQRLAVTMFVSDSVLELARAILHRAHHDELTTHYTW